MADTKYFNPNPYPNYNALLDAAHPEKIGSKNKTYQEEVSIPKNTR